MGALMLWVQHTLPFHQLSHGLACACRQAGRRLWLQCSRHYFWQEKAANQLPIRQQKARSAVVGRALRKQQHKQEHTQMQKS